MKKGETVDELINHLVDNSISACYAAIEIHNKPNIKYRYETTTILLINAWELILKAYIVSYKNKDYIYENKGKDENEYTVGIRKALDYVEEHINSTNPKSFSAIKENINAINKFRNSYVHLYNQIHEGLLFSLLAQGVINYFNFLKRYFKNNFILDDNFFVLPLSFKKPFDLNNFLPHMDDDKVSNEAKLFIDSIIRGTKQLKSQGIEDSIFFTYKIYFDEESQITNSDLLVQYSESQENNRINMIKKIQVTDDKGAQKMNLTDDEILEVYPLTYRRLCSICKEQISNFKQDRQFRDIMKQIKQNRNFAYVRVHNPKSTKSNNTVFYSLITVEEIKKMLFENYDLNQ